MLRLMAPLPECRYFLQQLCATLVSTGVYFQSPKYPTLRPSRLHTLGSVGDARITISLDFDIPILLIHNFRS